MLWKRKCPEAPKVRMNPGGIEIVHDTLNVSAETGVDMAGLRMLMARGFNIFPGRDTGRLFKAPLP